MSLSPTAKSTSDEILAYDKGWAALNRLIRSGRSFSGRERNCCFLNVGSTRFANVSSAVDLNLIDDGRGLASTDWDGDGRVDFWVTNRNGPRIRFLKNEYSTEYDFLALRLAGTRSNRDAIGARVEVFLAGQRHPLIRTLYAGSGYLSQSSKWLHFGLGAAAEVERVVVRWPGGQSETFGDVQANNRYRLVQGAGVAEPWQAPQVGRWRTSLAKEPPLPATSRVVLLRPAPLPEQLRCQDLQGKERPIMKPRVETQGLLVNLWATWCTNCLHELADWSDNAQALQDAGLDVLTLCVDEPTADRAADRLRIGTIARQLDIPFAVAVGDQQTVEILNVFQRAFIGRQSDLPLPSSILIDARGRLAVIYKGPVTAEQVLEDARLLNAPEEEIFAGAIPFDGRWLERPPTTVPRFAAMSLVEHGYIDAAEAYVRQLLPLYEPLAADQPGADSEENEHKKEEFSSLSHFLGAMLFDRAQYAEARKCYQTSLALYPNRRGVRQELLRTLMRMELLEPAAEQLEIILAGRRADPENLTALGRLRVRLGQPNEAIDLFEESIALEPSVELQFELANLLRDNKQYERAIQHYRDIMADVSNPVVANNLAWLLATASDDGVRDGAEAVRLARHACEVTSRKVPKILGTLAAAHAEQGDFDAAVRVAREALSRAREADEAGVIPEIQRRITQYENNQPTRD